MTKKIFFSWQSDLPTKNHRNFLENCIKKAIKDLGKDECVNIYMDYDRDTQNMFGSPDIVFSIFEKIEKSVLFICDISIINQECQGKKTPNPNVLIELGFAVKCLGWDKIICIFDKNSGKIEDLPFDLRQKRILMYDSNDNLEKNNIISVLKENIKSLFVSGKLFNPLNDYMKARIDNNLLAVCKQFANIMFGTISLSEGLANSKKFLELTETEIRKKLTDIEFPDFLFLNTYNMIEDDLREVLKEILSSTYFPKEWSYTILTFIEWLRKYKKLVSERYPRKILKYVNEDLDKRFYIIPGNEINKDNPINSQIVLEAIYENGEGYIDITQGKIINVTQYVNDPLNPLGKTCKIEINEVDDIVKIICDFKDICEEWLDITDSEFILDSEYFIIN